MLEFLGVGFRFFLKPKYTKISGRNARRNIIDVNARQINIDLKTTDHCSWVDTHRCSLQLKPKLKDSGQEHSPRICDFPRLNQFAFNIRSVLFLHWSSLLIQVQWESSIHNAVFLPSSSNHFLHSPMSMFDARSISSIKIFVPSLTFFTYFD